MADRRAEAPADSGPMSDRAFWGIFAGAWVVYTGLFCTVGLTESGDPWWAVRLAVLNAAPPAVMATLVALRRRDLLRPEWTLGRTVLVHVGVGLLFAVATAALVSMTAGALGYDEPDMAGVGKGTAFLYRVVTAGFLYAILAGYLMWAESLRRVHESRSLAAREAVLRAQAEAKAVRAQFKPHFVFNTLHSLMLLIRADPARAEQAIEDVATLIRYASILQRRDVDTVPLAKELEVARRYVALEKLRLEDRLRVTWSVPDGEDVAVPSFSLQTLLENAIKHGVEPRPEGGSVEVRVVIGQEVLELTVQDDGGGADPATVRGADGHGLDLLGQRLDALYGDQGLLTWETAPGRGFCATVRVPSIPAPSVQELSLIQPAEVGV